MPRETSIQVRVSFEEKDRIEARAKEAGIKPSEFIREVALGFADYKDLEDSGKIPEKLQAAAEDIGALAYETQHDKENKAKVRQAVENEESYEVKVEPGTLEQADKRIEEDLAAKDAFLSKRIPELKARMPSRRAEAQARKEWDEGEPF